MKSSSWWITEWYVSGRNTSPGWSIHNDRLGDVSSMKKRSFLIRVITGLTSDDDKAHCSVITAYADTWPWLTIIWHHSTRRWTVMRTTWERGSSRSSTLLTRWVTGLIWYTQLTHAVNMLMWLFRKCWNGNMFSPCCLCSSSYQTFFWVFFILGLSCIFLFVYFLYIQSIYRVAVGRNSKFPHFLVLLFLPFVLHETFGRHHNYSFIWFVIN